MAPDPVPDERDPSGDGASDDPGSLLREIARLPEARPPAAEPDRTGQQIAQFRVRSKLGQGAMGIVYAADDVKLQRRVALKLLPASLITDEERRRRLLREARGASAVLHPNLATVFDVGESEGAVFIAMELVEGVTLRRRLEERGGRLDAGEAARIARDVARGLGKAHRAGVVHRDLKPENVMISSDGEVKVLDFGLSKLIRAPGAGTGAAALGADADDLVSRVGHVVGTPAYMSPEQAAGEEVDARADVFSLGVMLHELVSGERPRRGTGPRDRRSAPAGARSLSPVLERCLRERPEDRFADANEVAEELDRVSRALAVRGGGGRAARLGGLAALALAGAAVAWGSLRSRAAPPAPAPGAAAAGSSSAAAPPRACASGADCTSGACLDGGCVPWATAGGTGALASFNSLAVAPNGDVVVAGHFRGDMYGACGPLSSAGSPDRHDMVVTRFDRLGHCLWSRRFGGPDDDSADGVTLTPAGHILVSGSFRGTADFGGGPRTSAGKADAVVLELDAEGRHLWSKTFGGTDDDFLGGVIRDAAGDLVVGGRFNSPSIAFGAIRLANRAPGYADVFLAKLSPRGDVVWAKAYGSPSKAGPDEAVGHAVDARGDVVVLGVFRDEIDFGGSKLRSAGMADTFLVKLSGADGSHLWSRRFGTATDEPYEGQPAFDPSGNVIIAGEHRGADFGAGALPGTIYVAKYTPSGDHVWSRGFGGTSPRDCARRVAIDARGDAVVFGRIFSPTVSFDGHALINGGGSDLYVARLEGATGRALAVESFFATDAPARALALHPATGNVVVGGRFEGTLRIGPGNLLAKGQDGYVASLGPPP